MLYLIEVRKIYVTLPEYRGIQIFQGETELNHLQNRLHRPELPKLQSIPLNQLQTLFDGWVKQGVDKVLPFVMNNSKYIKGHPDKYQKDLYPLQGVYFKKTYAFIKDDVGVKFYIEFEYDKNGKPKAILTTIVNANTQSRNLKGEEEVHI